MRIIQENHNQKVVLKLEGNFTYTQRKPFQEALKAIDTQNVEHIVIDLSQVAFLDSAALGLLMITHRQVQGEKRKLSLAYPQPTVRRPSGVSLLAMGLASARPVADRWEIGTPYSSEKILTTITARPADSSQLDGNCAVRIGTLSV